MFKCDQTFYIEGEREGEGEGEKEREEEGEIRVFFL